jgi:ATP-dependent helicase/nuclease subunit A
VSAHVELPEGDRTIYAFERNVVVAASAGTGKTHRLTALYLLLALGLTSRGTGSKRTLAPPLTPDRIVATTFSRAAAIEIRARAERALIAYSTWNGEDALPFSDAVHARLAEAFDPPPMATLRERALKAVTRLGLARIDTLHGVAARIVRRNALDLGLAPDVDVLDEEEARALGDLAVDEALSDALAQGGEPAESARSLLHACGGILATRERVLRMIDRLDEEGLTPGELATADHLTDARALTERLRTIGRELSVNGAPATRAPGAALAEILGRVEGDVVPRGVLLPLMELAASRAPNAAKRTAADDALAELFKESSKGKTKTDVVLEIVAELQSAPLLAGRERGVLALIEDARARFLAAKRREGGLGFGDLLRVARDALRDEPSIAKAARDEIDVLMVDEFQDTSRVQRDLAYLLRERDDSTRAPGETPLAEHLTPHGLFLVGDRKQSIYGFRGADVAVFRRIAVELAGPRAAHALALPDESPGTGADFVALRESRRSAARIIDFVNAFSTHDFSFGQPETLRPFELRYGPGEVLTPFREEPGRVVLLRDDGTTPEVSPPIVREAHGPEREAHIAAAYVACRVREDRDVAYRDVAILARRRATIPLLELALARLSVPYVVAGRALYEAQEVRDVAALLRLLLDPRDRLALATVLRGPMVALSDTALASLSVPGRGLQVQLGGRWPRASEQTPFASPDPSRLVADERARLEAFRARYAELRRPLLRLAPGDAVREAIRGFDLDRVLAALPRADARVGNLDRLTGIAQRRGGTLSSFVRWLDRRIRDEADESEAAVFSAEDDAVRITTIHASKGLDYRVVVLVDLNAQPRGDTSGLATIADGDARVLALRHYTPRPDLHRRPMDDDDAPLLALRTRALRAAHADAKARDVAERKRITYVAATRARDELVLTLPVAKPRSDSAWQSLATAIDASLLKGVVRDEEDDLLAMDLLARAESLPPPRTKTSLEPLLPSPRAPQRSHAELVAIDAPDLALFAGCARRFQLRVVEGLEEPRPAAPQLDLFAPVGTPSDAIDPFSRGHGGDDAPARAAHRVIERVPHRAFGAPADVADLTARLAREGLAESNSETRKLAEQLGRTLSGAYAASLASAQIDRQHPYRLVIPGNDRRLAVDGSIDLVVRRSDGAVEVVLFKTSAPRSDLSPFELELQLAALALEGDEMPRAGVLFVGETSPRWLAPFDLDPTSLRERLAAFADAIADARHHATFAPIPRPRCLAIGCGFVAACHR